MYDYKNMRYGSVALAYPRCKVEHIREVSISTTHGTYAYRIGWIKEYWLPETNFIGYL